MRNSSLYFLLVFTVFATRFTAVTFLETRQPKIRLATGLGLFAEYNILLYLFLTLFTRNIIPQNISMAEGGPYISVALLIFNVIMLFVGIVYTSIYKKKI